MLGYDGQGSGYECYYVGAVNNMGRLTERKINTFIRSFKKIP